MKHIVAFCVALTLFAISAVPASAQATCNSKCQVNEDCGTGYKCYVGVCRNAVCPSSPTCGCTTATASPSATPKIATTVATPRATDSGKLQVATTSAITKTPTTGPRETAGVALGLFLVGMAVYAVEYRKNRATL